MAEQQKVQELLQENLRLEKENEKYQGFVHGVLKILEENGIKMVLANEENVNPIVEPKTIKTSAKSQKENSGKKPNVKKPETPSEDIDCDTLSIQTYLLDTFLYEVDTVVLRASDSQVIVRDCIFHSQGGGQPSDIGEISNKGGLVFTVSMSKTLKSGQTVLSGTYNKEGSFFSEGEDVHCKIDKEFRLLNAKIHSAGHLLDLAVIKAGKNMHPNKGFHFAQSPYVEYGLGDTVIGDKDQFKKQLNSILDELTSTEEEIKVEMLTLNEVSERGLSIPKWAQNFEKLRIVTYGEISCPCSGTHLTNFKDIGKVEITKFRKKGKFFRIGYNVV